MKTITVLLSVLLSAGVVSGRQGRDFDFAALQDSLRDVPPKQRAWWLQDRGLDASYYTSYRSPDTASGLRLVGKWGRGPSVEVTGRGSQVALALGSAAALLDFSDPARPAVLAEVQLDYKTRQVALRDSLLITGGRGIQLWDILDPAHPVQLSVIPYGVFDFVLQDTLLLFASLDTFHVYNITDPANPRRIGHCPGSGYVTAASPGIAVLVRPDDRLGFIDITDPTLPRPVGTYPGWALSADIRGNLCCAAFVDPGNQDRSWFLTLDITDPANPRQLARLDNVCGYDMHLDGDYAILSGRYEAYEPFQVVSIADSTSPTLVGELDLPGQRWGVWSDLARGRAYVASDGCGLAVVDLSNVTAPRLDTVVMRADLALDVWVDGARAYIANYRAGMRILDISDPTRPTELGGLDSAGTSQSAVETVAARDSFAFSDWWPGPQFRSVLVSDPTNPREVATLTVPSRPADMVLRDTLVFGAGRMRFYVVNVARPREPVLVGSCELGGTPRSLTLAGLTAYAALGSGGFQVIDISDPARPQVLGAWRGRSSGIVVLDTLAFVTGPYAGIVSLSVANPAMPYVLDSLHLTDTLWWNDVAVVDSLAYVAGERIWAVDVSDPRDLRLVPGVSWTPPYLVRRLVYAAPYLYAACYEAGVAILEILPTGVVEKGGESKIIEAFRMLPSPVRGRLAVRLGREVRSWAVRDVTGRLVSSGAVRPEQRTLGLDLTDRPAGVYVLELTMPAGRVRGKFVKQ